MRMRGFIYPCRTGAWRFKWCGISASNAIHIIYVTGHWLWCCKWRWV